MSAPSTASWLIGKARDLCVLERELFAATELSLRERSRLLAARYAAILRDARQVEYLGEEFSYDGRLLPALLPSYLTDIRRLNEIVPLDGASIVDIGANVGQFGATVSRRFKRARVWSFEPNDGIVELLRRNAAGSANWTIVPWGVSDGDREESLWAVDGKSAQGSVYRGNAVDGLRASDAIEHRVELKQLTAERLDALGIPRSVDLVKIDVEGAEAAALAGLADLRWRFMAIETSHGREGGLTVAETCDLVESTWSERPTIIWADTPGPRDKTVDVVLALGGNGAQGA